MVVRRDACFEGARRILPSTELTMDKLSFEIVVRGLRTNNRPMKRCDNHHSADWIGRRSHSWPSLARIGQSVWHSGLWRDRLFFIWHLRRHCRGPREREGGRQMEASTQITRSERASDDRYLLIRGRCSKRKCRSRL